MLVPYPAYMNRRLVKNPRDILTFWFNNGQNPLALFKDIDTIARREIQSIIRDQQEAIMAANVLAKICADLEADLLIQWRVNDSYPFSLINRKNGWVVDCFPYKKETSSDRGIVTQKIVLLKGNDKGQISIVASAFKQQGYNVGQVERSSNGELAMMMKTSYVNSGFFGHGELYPIGYKLL